MATSIGLRIATALQALGESIEAYLGEREDDYEPSPNSIAERELRSKYESDDLGGVALAHHTAYMTIGIGTDCLRAASHLMFDDEKRISVSRYAVFPVLRSALEAGGLIYWLSTSEITTRERVQRGLRLAEYSRRMRALGEARLSTKTDSAYLDAIRTNVVILAERYKLVRLARQLREGSDISIPNATHLIENHFDDFGFDTSGGDAVAIYSRLSEPTHGNMLGTLGGYRPYEKDDGTRILVPHVPIAELAFGAHYAGESVAHASRTYFELMGWDWMSWRESAMEWLDALGTAAEEARQDELRRRAEELAQGQ